MSDRPYLMQCPERDELWLIDGDLRILIRPELYDLLVNNGAELPDAYGIKELREQNAKLRKLLLDVWNDAMQFDGFWDYVNDDGEIYNEDELPHYYDRMRELGIEVS